MRASRVGTTWQGGGDRTTGRLALLGALAGALAISGSLLTWASVGRAGVAIRGTSYTLGILTLVSGVIMLAGSIAWILTSQTRVRTASALAVAALGLTVVVTVGTALATGSLLDQAPAKAARHHRPGKASPQPTPTAVGLANIALDAPSGTTGAAPDLTGRQPVRLRIAAGNDHPSFRPLAKSGRRGRQHATLGPGAFIGLVGGILGTIAGLWALLGKRGNRPVLVAQAPRRVVSGGSAQPQPGSSPIHAPDPGRIEGPSAQVQEVTRPTPALGPGPDPGVGHLQSPGAEPV
jgi:hypothetical protein